MTLKEFKTTEFYKTTLDYYVSSGRFTEAKAKNILEGTYVSFYYSNLLDGLKQPSIFLIHKSIHF